MSKAFLYTRKQYLSATVHYRYIARKLKFNSDDALHQGQLKGTHEAIWYSHHATDSSEVSTSSFHWVEDTGKLLAERYFTPTAVEKDGAIHEGSKRILCFVEACHWTLVCKLGLRPRDHFTLLHVHASFVSFKISRKTVTQRTYRYMRL